MFCQGRPLDSATNLTAPFYSHPKIKCRNRERYSICHNIHLFSNKSTAAFKIGSTRSVLTGHFRRSLPQHKVSVCGHVKFPQYPESARMDFQRKVLYFLARKSLPFGEFDVFYHRKRRVAKFVSAHEAHSELRNFTVAKLIVKQERKHTFNNNFSVYIFIAIGQNPVLYCSIKGI